MAALPNENEGYPREEIYGGPSTPNLATRTGRRRFRCAAFADPSRPNGRRGRAASDRARKRSPRRSSTSPSARRSWSKPRLAPRRSHPIRLGDGRQAKEEWRNLDNQLRAPYQEKARRDRERYELEMASYVKPEAGQSVANELTERMVTKMGRLKKDPQRPKHPRSAYFYYLEINRQRVMEENPAMSVPDVTRTLAEGWRGLSEADKVSYEEKAAADRVRFEDEMKVYEPSETYKASKEKYGEQKRMKAEAKAHQGVGSSSLARMAADTPYGVQFTKEADLERGAGRGGAEQPRRRAARRRQRGVASSSMYSSMDAAAAATAGSILSVISSDDAAGGTGGVRRPRGRPPGSKNKPKPGPPPPSLAQQVNQHYGVVTSSTSAAPAAAAAASSEPTLGFVNYDGIDSIVPHGPAAGGASTSSGQAPTTIVPPQHVVVIDASQPLMKRKRGRPLGSKNKPKLPPGEMPQPQLGPDGLPIKRKRGRPPGSKNKPKAAALAHQQALMSAAVAAAPQNGFPVAPFQQQAAAVAAGPSSQAAAVPPPAQPVAQPAAPAPAPAPGASEMVVEGQIESGDDDGEEEEEENREEDESLWAATGMDDAEDSEEEDVVNGEEEDEEDQ